VVLPKKPGLLASLFDHAKGAGSDAHQAALDQAQGLVDAELQEFDKEATLQAELVRRQAPKRN
jgi:hypothetical protein